MSDTALIIVNPALSDDEQAEMIALWHAIAGHAIATREPAAEPEQNELTDEEWARRFDLYGALWLLCSRYHSGQGSRGYRILCRLVLADYSPGLTIESGRFETEEQRALYLTLAARYRHEL